MEKDLDRKKKVDLSVKEGMKVIEIERKKGMRENKGDKNVIMEDLKKGKGK